ncbi:EAL domain-containing protein [Leucothrix sargassi]|nr:EAL domain-containing protein [Leucothrix sargassi]
MMISFNRLSLSACILLAPITGIILTLVIFGNSYYLVRQHASHLNDLHVTALPKLTETTQAMVLLSQHNAKLHDLISHSPESLSVQERYTKGREFLLGHQELEQFFSMWTHDTSAYVSEFASRKDIDYLMTQIMASLGLYSGQAIAALDHFSYKQILDGNAVDNPYLHNTTEIIQDINAVFLSLSRLQALKLKQRSQALEQAEAEQRITMIISLALMCLMLLFTLFYSRRVSRAVSDIHQTIVALASGAKPAKLPSINSQDLAQLKGSLSLFKSALLKEEQQKQQIASTIRELSESQERYYNLLNISATAIITLDQNLEVVMFNRAAERVYGYMREEVIGESIRLLIPEKDCADYLSRLKVFSNSKKDFSSIEANVVRSAKRKSGEVFPVEVRLGKTTDSGMTLITMSTIDITERLRAEEEIRHKAYYDSLTGLPNRLLSLQRLREFIKEAEDLACQAGIMFLDLDDFKKVNDSMGHEAGDLLLVEAAKRLTKVLGDDGCVGRLGGDEFIVLLNRLDSVDKAREIAQQLVIRFREPFDVDGRRLVLTTSIGISFYPDDATSSSALLKNADSAMYYSKKLGRNTFSVFTPDMEEGVSRRLLIEEHMRGGLLRNEFTLNYQPKVDLRTHKVTAVEALVRWENEALGQVRPDEFIPVAEQSGQIIELGRYVILESLRALKAWTSAGYGIGIAINLSPRQFHDPNLVAFIRNQIEVNKLDPSLVELEITEGVLMNGHTYVTQTLTELNQLGVKLAMDDFGTGFSSLSYLRQYSFDILKIDRSFVADMMRDSGDKELVNTIIAMAHSLGLEVVAEGVETIEQLEYLQQQGCEYAQGYLQGKPMTFDLITQSLSEQSKDSSSTTVA